MEYKLESYNDEYFETLYEMKKDNFKWYVEKIYGWDEKIQVEFQKKFIKEHRNNIKVVKYEDKVLIEKEITLPKPKFLKGNEEEKITSAMKGTLVHLCMQRLDEKTNYDLEKVKELLEELEAKKIITTKEKEAINPRKILEFTKSKIWEELKTAKEIEREKPFYINVKAKDIYKEETDENILVQGIIDLYYIDKDDNLNLVDYKTDYVEAENEQELVNKYRKQLDLYKQALEQAYNKQVKNTYIYSVYLDKEIKIYNKLLK